MKITLSKNEAINILLKDEYAKWTYKEAEAIVEYLMDYEDSIGEEIEIDPTAIRIDFKSYTYEEFIECYKNYPEIENLKNLPFSEQKKQIKDFVEDRWIFIEVSDDGFIVIWY